MRTHAYQLCIFAVEQRICWCKKLICCGHLQSTTVLTTTAIIIIIMIITTKI